MLAHNDEYGLLSMIFIFNFYLLLPHCCDISWISNIAQSCLWEMSPTQVGTSRLKATNFALLGNSSQCRGHAAPLQQGYLLLAKPCEEPSPEYGCASPALLCQHHYLTLATLQVCSCPTASTQECLPSHMPKQGSEIEITENSDICRKGNRPSSNHGAQSFFTRG